MLSLISLFLIQKIIVEQSYLELFSWILWFMIFILKIFIFSSFQNQRYFFVLISFYMYFICIFFIMWWTSRRKKYPLTFEKFYSIVILVLSSLRIGYNANANPLESFVCFCDQIEKFYKIIWIYKRLNTNDSAWKRLQKK